jgi:hypothetical protein
MVCEDCARKNEKLVTPVMYSESSDKTGASKSVIKNMILHKRKYEFDPMGIRCLTCKGRVENKNKYCLTCAYKNGICEMCGKKLVNTKLYKYSDIDPKDAKRKLKMEEKTRNIASKIIVSKGLNKIEGKILNKFHKNIKNDNNDKTVENEIFDINEEEAKLFGETGEDQGSKPPEIEENEYDEIIKI